MLKPPNVLLIPKPHFSLNFNLNSPSKNVSTPIFHFHFHLFPTSHPHQLLPNSTSFSQIQGTPTFSLTISLGLIICFITLKLSLSLLQGALGLGIKPFHASQKTRPNTSCAINMSAAHSSDDDRKLQFDRLINKVRKLWDNSPQPVKNFPWNATLGNFIELVIDLTVAVVKYLYVPVFTVTSISELSYCARQRKLVLVPVPILLGAAVAGILNQTALELSPRLRVKSLAMPHCIYLYNYYQLYKCLIFGSSLFGIYTGVDIF